MSTYRGFDVLDVTTHDLRDRISEAFARRGELAASPTGIRTFDDYGGIAFPTRNFLWTARGRADVLALRAFLDARGGRRVPFWVPTCCWDLPLAADASSLAANLLVLRCGYPERLYPNPARRDLAIFPPGAAASLARVTAAINHDATSDQVTIDVPVAAALPADRTVISFLALCRLAEDFTRLSWSGTAFCEASISFVELPLEVPA